MANSSSNVSVGKPKIGGAIYVASVGTDLPVSAVATLDEDFKGLGYVSEDGVTNADSRESEEITAWGGDVVATPQTSRSDAFSFTLIECMNVDVLKFVYGSDNVSGALATGITIAANSKPQVDVSVVIDMILNGDVLKRIVLPVASISEVGEITYVDNEPIGYETTVSCKPDSTGNTHYEYIQTKPAPTPGPEDDDNGGDVGGGGSPDPEGT